VDCQSQCDIFSYSEFNATLIVLYGHLSGITIL